MPLQRDGRAFVTRLCVRGAVVLATAQPVADAGVLRVRDEDGGAWYEIPLTSGIVYCLGTPCSSASRCNTPACATATAAAQQAAGSSGGGGGGGASSSSSSGASDSSRMRASIGHIYKHQVGGRLARLVKQQQLLGWLASRQPNPSQSAPLAAAGAPLRESVQSSTHPASQDRRLPPPPQPRPWPVRRAAQSA